MPSNVGFLKIKPEYALFSRAAIEAENALSVSPSLAAAGARKALELAVKWVYSADSTMYEPDKPICKPLFTSHRLSCRWTGKHGRNLKL
jgi:type I restriction enzyme R subunit